MFKFNNIHLDDENMWPSIPRVKLDKPFKDDRGYIQSLVNFPMKNLCLIFSKKGTVRSNHYHKEDWHYMFTLKGKYQYFYKDHSSDDKPKIEIFEEGEMVFTPPEEDHACFFLEDTMLIVASRMPRGDQKTYEKDVCRINLIDSNGIIING